MKKIIEYDLGNGRAEPLPCFAYLLVIGIWMFSNIIRLRWRQFRSKRTLLRGQTAEIRCTLKRGGEFADTRYTIRYFQSDGKGLLRNDNGTVFKPNDRYPLTKNVFRLYYTSLSSDRQRLMYMWRIVSVRFSS